MFWRKTAQALLDEVLYAQKKIERNQTMILRNQTSILDRLIALERKSGENAESSANEWIQQGIDSIMGYQWPPAKGGNE